MSTVRIVEACSDGAIAEAQAIRHRVFCIEQGVSRDEELDGLDGESRHYLARVDGTSAGTARIRRYGPDAVKIERMAVVADHRGEGIGRALLDRIVRDAREAGHGRAVLHAQCHAAGFYRRFGFEPAGEVFEEAGIDHVRMEMPLG